MISGSVAVEGQNRLLGQGAPVAEFLRPLPRAPYRYPAHSSHIPQPHPHTTRLRPDDDEAAQTAYHPPPQPYHRTTMLPYQFPYYYATQPPSVPVPPPPPPPPPPPLAVRAPRSPPRGKEGSLKHRLLSRATTPSGFSRGALIQLGSGQLRRVEDMRTEDFISSADRSPELQLADSTVVRLLRRPATDSVTLTLSYNKNTAQVDMESPVEHPFFVYGHGWASCSPERTLKCYGLQVNRLQVGDVCVSLIRRETPAQQPQPQSGPIYHQQPAAATIVTTATTTAMTVRAADAPQSYPENLSLREDSRKRRWSAPDTCDDENSQRPRTMRH